MASFNEFTPEVEECISKFLESGRNKKLSFVVVGKTGAGKSQIINSLIGQHVAEEGHTLDAKSKRTVGYKTRKNGIEITIWDTCGLGDLTQNTDEEYVNEIEQIRETDLFLFCTNMTATRFDQSDLDCVMKFTQAFGVKMWRNAMVVLTFANQVCPQPTAPGSINLSLEDHFSERKRMFKAKYYQTLVSAGVVGDLEVHKLVPIITAGHLYQPTLPVTEDWRQRLWLEAFRKLDNSSKPAFIFASTERLVSASKLSSHPRNYLVGSDGEPFSSALQYSHDKWPSAVSLGSSQTNNTSNVAVKKMMFENVLFQHERRKQNVVPAEKNRHTCDGEVPIIFNEENEKGFCEVIIGSLAYGQAGAEAGRAMSKIFPNVFNPVQGKLIGFALGEFIAFLQAIILRLNRKK